MARRRQRFDAIQILDEIESGRSDEYLRMIEDTFEDAISDEEQDGWDAAFELQLLAPSVAGARAIKDGDQAGWRTIHRAWLYEVLSHVLCTFRFESGSSPVKYEFTWVELNRVCHWLCYTIASHEDRFADWLGSRLLANLREQSDLVKTVSWRPFESFAAKLYATWRGEELALHSHPAFDLKTYQCVFDSWEDKTALGDALRTICDYHCQDIGDDDGPFTSFPFSIIPAEIAALRRVRHDLGLATPDLDHPLIDSPFAQIPARIESITDDRLERVLAKCRAENPDFEPPW